MPLARRTGRPKKTPPGLSDMTSPSSKRRPEATVRALVVRDDTVLLVSNGGDFWYTPGGRIEYGEDAEEAVIRELKEETGLDGRLAGFSHVEQFFKPARGLHHINLYFYVDLVDPAQAMSLEDPDGQVALARFFDLEALKPLNVNPLHLKTGWWRERPFAPWAWKGADRA